MKFGKLESINGVDFSLPPDHSRNLATVVSTADQPPLSVYSGGTMWNIREWRGKWYPEKTPIKNFGQAYCKLFNTIELNATHYKIYPPETILKWKAWADADFKFCPKFPNLISHYRQFNNCEGLTDEFLHAVSHFEENLGPCFLQLPERISTKQAEKIQRYLTSLPRDIAVHIEFRHQSWFSDDPAALDTWLLMEDLGIGSVITDTAGRRDALHMRLTTDTLILRFGGNELDPSDFTRLNDWHERITSWHSSGLRAVYLWMHQPNSILSPETCQFFDKLFTPQEE